MYGTRMQGAKAKSLNIKNMKETLVNFCGGDSEEYDRIWGAYHDMACLGFITRDTWDKFWEQTASWVIDGDYLIDNNTGKVIFDFDNGRHNNRNYEEYRA